MGLGRRKKLAGIISIAASVAMLAVSAPNTALAHFDDSRVSLSVSDRTVTGDQKVVFFGRLRNEHNRCVGNEVILLKRRGTGTVARDRTDGDGEFRFRIDPQPNHGRYFARYRGKGRFGYANRHRCGADRSRTIRIRRG